MENRLALQNKLEEILGKRHVYFQPPDNLTIEYPAIKYSILDIDSKYANNIKYSNADLYQIIVIDEKPGNKAIRKILELPYSSYDRHYKADNRNHDVINLYF